MAAADKKIPALSAPAPVAMPSEATAAAAGAAKAKTYLNEGATQTRAAMEKNMEQATRTAETFFKAAEEAAEFGRGNLEAVAKSAQLWTSGVQDLGRQYVTVAQGMADQAMEIAKALAAVKSLKEAADLQTTYAKSTLEKTLAETARLQEATVKLAEAANAPLTQRMQLAMEKITRPVAA
jgi:phasin family protein